MVKTQLMHMGFDAKSVDLIMEKNADSTTDTLLEACTRGLLQLSEWQASLDDVSMQYSIALWPHLAYCALELCSLRRWASATVI